MFKLNANPMLNEIVLIDDATPLLCGGTEFIIELVFGETKRPVPTPSKNSAIINDLSDSATEIR